MTVTDRPTEPMRPLDDYTQKVLRSRARGAVYPYELAPLLAGPGGSFVEHDLDDTPGRRLVPVERPPGRNRAGIVAGLVTTPTERHPEGMTRVVAVRRPDQGAGHRLRARVRARHRRARPRRGARAARRVVRPVLGRPHLDGQRHREHGLGGARAAPAHHLHAGRRRGERRRGRHQRRRAAVLERRGDDAAAHQGHPRHDARQRHGAHRQALARLLRRRLGRGQLRHRRLRPGHGARTARRSTGRRTSARPSTCCSRTTSTATSRRASAGRGARRRPTRSTATCASSRTSTRRATSPPSATSSPRQPTPSARSRSTSAR